MTNSTDAVQTSHSVVSDMYLYCLFRPFSLITLGKKYGILCMCECVRVCACVCFNFTVSGQI